MGVPGAGLESDPNLGVLMAGIGIVGEYVGRIYQQVRGRPRFLIRKVWRGN